ncbi:MAG: undecaprenyl-phosphate glucose phosphotransferase [Sphingobacteriia bacterium]|nr:undecaprenyl-phosphate glucose phosphotransferase [Sphingobacteriia bacterium]
MQVRYSRFIRRLHYLGDLLLLNLCYLGADLFKNNQIQTFERADLLTLLIVFNLAWLVSVQLFKSYDIHRVTSIERVIRNLLQTLLFHLLLIFTVMVILKYYEISRKQILITYVAYIFTVILYRVLFLKSLKLYRRLGFNYRRVLIIGAGPVGNDLYDFFTSDTSLGYKFLGFFDDHPEKCYHKDQVIGSLDDVENFALTHHIDEIYCALPDSAGEKIRSFLQFCEKNLIRFRIVLDFKRHVPRKFAVDFYGSIPILLPRKEPMELITNQYFKRTFDIAFSLLVIILVFTWLFPILAILIKLSSKGPVFFKQQRSGKRNEVFTCYKFRSMKVNEDSDTIQAHKSDDRITGIGKFLRKTSMDELPQFFNVLNGDMSVVGPRPHMLKHTEEYSQIIDNFMVRHFVKPGITGWAQVHGFRGETHQDYKMRKRVQYDVWYIENWSFLLDIRIIFMTVRNLLLGDRNAF